MTEEREKKLHTVRSVANHLQVCEETVRRWLRDGMPYVCKMNDRAYRIELRPAMKWLNNRRKKKNGN